MLAALLGMAGAEGAGAGDPAALLAQARAAERAGRPAEEAAACQALVALGAGGRPEQACRERLYWLAARQDPAGGWAGLAGLERTRRAEGATQRRLSLGALSGDPAVAAAVRAEASATLADLALERGAGPEALALTAAWWPGEDLPQDTRRRVGRSRAAALLAVGQAAAAQQVEDRLAVPGGSAVADQLAADRRTSLGWTSRVLAIGWALVAIPLAGLGWAGRPRPVPGGLLPLWVVGLGGLVLAAAWEPAVAWPFAALLSALVLMHLVVVGAGLALQDRPTARGLFGALSAAATVAVAFIILQRGQLLSWVGL